MKSMAIFLALALFPGALLAQDRAETFTAEWFGVYETDLTLDPALVAYPAIHDAIRDDEIARMLEFAALAITDYRNWTEEAPEWSWNGYFSSTDVQVSFAGRGVVSLQRTTSIYSGGAHPNQGVAPVLTRDNAYSPVELASLFNDAGIDSPAMTALFYAVYRELMAMKRERLGADFDEALERDSWLAPLAADPAAFPGFTLIPNETGDAAAGLMFHFEPYAVGSYAEGSYSVPVPLSVFEDFLTADWAGVFAGDPDQAVLTAPGDALEPIIPEE